jgi:hypothetical protein
MRQEYYGVFEELYGIYKNIYGRSRRVGLVLSRSGYPFARGIDDQTALQLANDAVNSAVQKLGVTLRPDAKHFLVVNLHQMVILPISHRLSTVRLLPDELRSRLTDDVLKILQHATEVLPHHDAVTSSQILKATSNLWDKLRLGELEIWG